MEAIGVYKGIMGYSGNKANGDRLSKMIMLSLMPYVRIDENRHTP